MVFTINSINEISIKSCFGRSKADMLPLSVETENNDTLYGKQTSRYNHIMLKCILTSVLYHITIFLVKRNYFTDDGVSSEKSANKNF